MTVTKLKEAIKLENEFINTIEEYGLDIQFHPNGWRVFQNLNCKKLSHDKDLKEGWGETLIEAFENWKIQALSLDNVKE